jgi:hypothetical protein
MAVSCANSQLPARQDAGRPCTKGTTMCSRTGGDAADPHNNATSTAKMQELASAGPSAIESFGPEPGGPMVRVEVSGPDGQPFTFMLRCGLFAAGGERE